MNCAEVGANGTGFLSEGESALAPGALIDGKYRVEKLIAVGGMAAVWSGRNIRTDKRVALKVILRSLSNKAEVMARFRREALAAGRIHHPNVVVVFDVVEHEGLTCMVMELLDGEPLIELLQRRGFLPEEEVVSLLLPAMRGVEAAHRQGVIHRDLKPHNIFVCRTPEGDVANTKVLDFGVSKLKEEHPDPHAITVAGTMTGTPAYMAPEQVMGVQNADPRTDVYAMGVVLFQSLAGRPPFEDPSYPALLVRIATEKPPSIGRIRPDVSESMQAIIERAIAKNPDDRFPDMGAFIHALENGLKPPEPYERRLREIAPAESVRTSLHAVPAVADLTDRVHVTSRRPWWGLAAGGVIGVLCLLLWLLIQDDPIKTPPAAQSGPAVVPRPSLMIPPAPATVPGTLMGERGPAATATAGTAGQAQGTASRPASGEASGASVAAGKDGVEASSADGNGEHRRRARRSARVGNGLDLRDGRTDEATVPQNDGTGSADPSTQETQPQGTPGRAATWPQPRAPRAGNLSPDDF